MINKVLLIAFCALLCSNLLFCQNRLSVRGKMTYNFLSSDDLKQMQSQTLLELRQAGIQARDVESFPPYYGLQVQLLYLVSDSSGINIGAYFEQFSTGGRVQYKDYSGEIRFDQVLDAKAFGAMAEKSFNLKHGFTFSLNIGLSYIWDTYEMTTINRIYTIKQQTNLALDNSTIGVLPGASLSWEFYKFLVTGSLGYQFCLNSSFKYNDQPVKNTDTGNEITPGMDGLRLGIGLGYNF